MRRITWGLAAAISALVDLSPAATLADCQTKPPDAAAPNAVCEVVRLGWRVVDPGPPLWFRTNDGLPRVDVAVAELGRPLGRDDPIRWAKTKLTGPKGAFGPFGDCRGNLNFPDGAKKITGIDCIVPSGPDGPRQGSMLVVETTAGLQAIGVAMPARVKPTQINFKPLTGLVADGRSVGIMARAARAAIAMFMGREYYLAPDAGISEPTIEGVYHLWRWELMVNRGMVDTGTDYVLFKNGEVWRSPGAAPQDIDPAKFKEARWDDWGIWRRAGGNVILTMNGQAEARLPSNQLARYDPAGADQRVEGRWQWSSGFVAQTAVGNTTSGVASRSITLHADGRFEQNGFGSTSFSDEIGGRRTAGAFATPAPAQSGRYRINGYSLEVTYDDGRRDSALFYWAGDNRNNRYSMLVINGAKFLGGVSR
ncbi:MAG TPA: hypothetical protein VGJ20_37735 [Xanthobacteraceae bacterium]|jgi:hypothetical protein